MKGKDGGGKTATYCGACGQTNGHAATCPRGGGGGNKGGKKR